jgi:osmotically-inducible protein OsmY
MRTTPHIAALIGAAARAAAIGCGRHEQATSAADREVTQKIRQALVADDSLSSSAKNVTIDSDADSVTLKGSVASEQERAAVAAKARQAAGSRTIDNELVVASR